MMTEQPDKDPTLPSDTSIMRAVRISMRPVKRAILALLALLVVLVICAGVWLHGVYQSL